MSIATTSSQAGRRGKLNTSSILVISTIIEIQPMVAKKDDLCLGEEGRLQRGKDIRTVP